MSSISRSKSVLTLLLISLSSACASFAGPSLVTLELRTLRLSRDFAGFEYRYEVCRKTFLGACVKKEWVVDKYDLTDPKVRAQLVDMGFVARVREKVQ
jgi:hypothetical protein